MRNSRLVWISVGMAALLCSSIAHAQHRPPVIEVQEMTRTVEAVAAPEGVFNFAEETTIEGGPFVHNLMVSDVGAEGTQTTVSADHDTDISTFSIRGTGMVDAASTVNHPDGFSDTNAASGIEMRFTVRADTEFSLSGTLDSSVDSATVAFARLNLVATDADGEPIVVYEISSNPLGGEVDFIVFDTFKANTEIYLEVRAYVLNLSTGQGDLHGYASFDMELDLGDRDGDGLLDAWEEDGIDFNNDDIPEIDLPALGSDPDHKDLFVEVDVMAGVSFDAAIVPMLEEAFGDAPQRHVSNPDGIEGINLHVVWDDGDAPTTGGGDANIVNFNELYAIKEQKFGSQKLRDHPLWLGEDGIKEARKLIYRYGLICNTLSLGPGLPLGVGERPGNDFIVAAGLIEFEYFSSPYLRKAMAGVFMHELGHNLGLRHGGFDDITYKPNHPSVMNYIYSTPRDVQTAQGTNAADIFVLDYSRKAARTVNESQLDENTGLGGQPGRKVIFNSAPSGNDPVATIGRADSAAIDWNNNREADPIPFALDISRLKPSQGVELEELVPLTDWDRIWYSLRGAPGFQNRVTPGTDSLPTNITVSELREILSVEWVDQTALTDEIFWDDFETGDISAWSE